MEVSTTHRRHPGDPTIHTVINKTRRPLKISLPRGKTLYLGPSAKGQVHDDTLERPAFKKMVEAGEVEVVGQDDERAAGGDTSTSRVQRASHGHPSNRSSSRRGDR